MTGGASIGQIEVIRTVQGMLFSLEDRSAITPLLIGDKIDRVLLLAPAWGAGLDREAVIEELIRRCSLWIGKDSILSDDRGHIPWLTAERKRGRKYWRRYEDWLDRKLARINVDAIDGSTEAILELLEDPLRGGTWDRRGLVVGHVQSGKTAHYIGLINKAADAGYKIIVVLAGLHKNLRSQTQVRLDEGFLGFDTDPEKSRPPVGVGERDPDPETTPDYATNRSDSGDFNPSNTRNFGITPDRRPCLFVVKKNSTPLNRLLRWLQSHVAYSIDPETKRKIVTDLPLLLIDDEADNASVDTGDKIIGEDGKPNPEHDPTTINKLIRRILGVFTRSAYVGYTATPFANIFIHEKAATRREGPDLFPSAFIYNLAASSDYIGPCCVFGLRTFDGRSKGLPVLRIVEDHCGTPGAPGWMPVSHKVGHVPKHQGEDLLPPSLVEAVDAFILACAAKRLRGQGNKHASMLVHVTRFNLVQDCVERQVAGHLQVMRQHLSRRIGHESILDRLRHLWEKDFAPSTLVIKQEWPALSKFSPSIWEDVEAVLFDALDEIKVRTINGTAKDVLDYTEAEEVGLKVIAIGGDKLSRGLTLEGLCVSYFLRASKMYDTLMQMGRWFGYRPGYADLCRLYTTQELVDWFGHITDASEELREEFDIMVNSKETPLTYGHKVASHPVLMVTSRLKMRSAQNLWLSFSGDVLETVVFHNERRILERNMTALVNLLSSLGNPVERNEIVRPRPNNSHNWEGHLWNGVEPEAVCGFLEAFSTHSESYKVNSALLAEFIRSMNTIGELTSWTVALIGGGEGRLEGFANLDPVHLIKRKDKGRTYAYTIGRLLSPRDEAIDLNEADWQLALEESVKAFHADPARGNGHGEENRNPPTEPSGRAVRLVRGKHHPERGLLLLYALDPDLAGPKVFRREVPAVVGFGISFPSSRNAKKVKYVVNSVMLRQWEREYDLAE